MSNINPKIPTIDRDYRGEFKVEFDYLGYHFFARAEWIDEFPSDLGHWVTSIPSGTEPYQVITGKKEPGKMNIFIAVNAGDHADAMRDYRRALKFEKGDWCYTVLHLESALKVDNGDPEGDYVRLMTNPGNHWLESDIGLVELKDIIAEEACSLIGVSRQRLIEIYKAYRKLCQEYPL